MDLVRQERTGWRDEAISKRHRLWGFDCPMADVDFLVVEYNVGQPVAVVEYKHFLARDIDMRHATYRALEALADRAGLPFLVAIYWPDVWAFRVIHCNEHARPYFTINETITERRFVVKLYQMRMVVVKEHAIRSLNNELPDDLLPGPRVVA